MGIFLDRNTTISAVFKYHELCQNNIELLCFHDSGYFCLCTSDQYRAECIIHNVQVDHCDYCFSSGKCLKGDLDDRDNFICICPNCYQGYLCEFSLHPFGFTLDSLLLGYSKEINIVYVATAFVLFTIGLLNNLCAFVTFRQPKPRIFGVGNYLLVVTGLNQIALFCLLLKLIQIASGLVDVVSCKMVSYFLSVSARSVYWLTSWVTVERLMIILFPTSFNPRNPPLAIKISIATVLLLLGIHVHEIIYYTTLKHRLTDSPICVTKFDTRLISVYNRVSTIIHYLVPFFIQLISITLLIILVARSRVRIVGQKINLHQVLNDQFQIHREHYMMPMIIVFSVLPQTILAFSFACTDLTNWQRHAVLWTYLLSYIPQSFSFFLYILPSNNYMSGFKQTCLARVLSRINFKKRH